MNTLGALTVFSGHNPSAIVFLSDWTLTHLRKKGPLCIVVSYYVGMKLLSWHGNSQLVIIRIFDVRC